MTDGRDPTNSSEDLIRQARQAYEPAEAAASQAPYVVEAARPAPVSVSETLPQGTRAPEDPITRPSDYVRDEYRDQPMPVAGDGATTYEAQRPSFIRQYGRFLVFGVIIVGVIVFNMFDKTKDVEDLAVGDCLLLPTAEEISSIESAACDANHELEVFGLVTALQSVVAPYPGEDALYEDMYNQCLNKFQPYVGASFDESVWYVNAIYPTRESWEEADDRAGTCVLFQLDANLETMTLTGSARGSNQ